MRWAMHAATGSIVSTYTMNLIKNMSSFLSFFLSFFTTAVSISNESAIRFHLSRRKEAQVPIDVLVSAFKRIDLIRKRPEQQ